MAYSLMLKLMLDMLKLMAESLNNPSLAELYARGALMDYRPQKQPLVDVYRDGDRLVVVVDARQHLAEGRQVRATTDGKHLYIDVGDQLLTVDLTEPVKPEPTVKTINGVVKIELPIHKGVRITVS